MQPMNEPYEPSETNKFFNELKGLGEDMDSLRKENERLKHECLYWRIEAQTDHDRWLRCLADLEQVRKAGASLSKEAMVVMLNASAHEELIKAHDDWKDLIDGKPNWGKTCTK